MAPRSRTMIRRLTPLLALLVLTTVCFARLAVDPTSLIVDAERPNVDDRPRGEEAVPGNDLTRLFLPHHLRIAREVREYGRISTWDDFGFGGRPRVGNPQAGLGYPPAWLAWTIDHPAALGWITIGHLLWAGWGTYRLSRTYGVRRFASVIASGCVLASPYVLAQANEGHLPHVWAFSWYPWAFLAARRLSRGKRFGVAGLALALAASLMAGHPQEGYYLVLTLAVWATVNIVSTFRASGTVAGIFFELPTRRIGAWGLAFALAIGLTAGEMLPIREAGAWGLRDGTMSLKHASQYHVNPLNLLQLLDPFALGGPAEYEGTDNYWETVLSFGWAPLILGSLAWSRAPRRFRSAVRAWTVVVGLSVLFAAGWRLGFFALWYQLVPGMDRFRVPARALFFAALGGGLLAGFGVETLARLRDSSDVFRRYRRLVVFLAIGFLGSVVLTWTLGPALPDPLARVVRAAVRIGSDPVFGLSAMGLFGALAVAARHPEQSGRMAMFVGVLALVELAAHGAALIRTTPLDRAFAPDSVAEAIRQAAGDVPRPFRVRALDTLYPDLPAAVAGLEKINIHDSFQLQASASQYRTLYALFRRSDDAGRPMDEAVARFRREVRGAVLNLWNVAFLVADRAPEGFEDQVVARGTRNGKPFVVCRNPDVLPRAYVVPKAIEAVPSSDPLVALRSVNGREAVILDGPEALSANTSRQPFMAASTRQAGGADRLIVEIETEAAGYLVVSQAWMPGWTATLNGRPTAVVRANFAQQAVVLPGPGRHRVAFRYDPPGLAVGLIVSGISLTAVVGLAAVSVMTRKRRTLNAYHDAGPAVLRGTPRRPENEDVLRQPGFVPSFVDDGERGAIRPSRAASGRSTPA